MTVCSAARTGRGVERRQSFTWALERRFGRDDRDSEAAYAAHMASLRERQSHSLDAVCVYSCRL